jgi:hypothetical protein
MARFNYFPRPIITNRVDYWNPLDAQNQNYTAQCLQELVNSPEYKLKVNVLKSATGIDVPDIMGRWQKHYSDAFRYHEMVGDKANATITPGFPLSSGSEANTSDTTASGSNVGGENGGGLEAGDTKSNNDNNIMLDNANNCTNADVYGKSSTSAYGPAATMYQAKSNARARSMRSRRKIIDPDSTSPSPDKRDKSDRRRVSSSAKTPLPSGTTSGTELSESGISFEASPPELSTSSHSGRKIIKQLTKLYAMPERSLRRMGGMDEGDGGIDGRLDVLDEIDEIYALRNLE